MPTVTSRVVAEIYRGIEFPANWIDKPDVLNLGMARDLLVSVAAMFDADLKPIALCWRVDGREERFVHAQPNDPDGSSLLDELHRDLSDESLRLGPADLLATMLWAPDELRPEQGQPVHRIAFAPGRYGYSSMTGWNIAVRTLVAKAGNLLFMTRRADDDLAFPMPTDIEEMHQQMESGDPGSSDRHARRRCQQCRYSRQPQDGTAVRWPHRARGTDQRVSASAKLKQEVTTSFAPCDS